MTCARGIFLLSVALLPVVLGCEAEVRPERPGSYAFALLGDAPYTDRDEAPFEQVLKQINAEELAWVIHLGDILSHPCSDSVFQARFQTFQQVRHPMVYTPGDNEWTDCHRSEAESYQPRERLAKLREVFFPNPAASLGGRRLPLTSQSQDTTFSEFVENARWVREQIVFTTIHVVGSQNGRQPFEGRTAEDDAEVERRMSAAIAWLREAFAVAHGLEARAVFIGIHANPAFTETPNDPRRAPFDPFLEVLEEEVERFGGPVLLAHGDTHTQRIDHPLTRRATGQPLNNFTRLEVFGSPDVGWVRVVVDTLNPELFAFHPQKIRRPLF